MHEDKPYSAIHVIATTRLPLLQKAFLHTGGIDLHMRLAGPHVAAVCEDIFSHAVDLRRSHAKIYFRMRAS